MPKHKTVKPKMSVRTAKEKLQSFWESAVTSKMRPPMKPPMKGDKK